MRRSDEHVGVCMLAVAVVIAAIMANGCGGPPREVRVALEQAAVGLDLADEHLTARIVAAGEEARAQVRDEVRSGAIAGETPEATIAAGLARFEELMAPTTLARTVLRTARSSTLSVERVVDAWAAGSGDEASFIAAAACAAAALVDAANAVTAAGVEVPSELTSAIAFLAPLARGVCPGGA